MKLDKSGLVMVAGAALVLYMVVKKTTVVAPTGTTQGNAAPGANNASFFSQWIAAATGATPAQGTAMPTSGEYIPGIAQFGLQTFGNGSTLSSSGQVDIGGTPIANLSTGTIMPGAGGLYGLSPTYGYGSFGS
jgi:hypothetical protein